MNLLFFLTPKSEVLYVDSHDTVRQVMERMEYHTYQAIPMIDSYGHYVGTITEGDILWWIKDDLPFDMKKAETEYIGNIPRKRENLPVSIQSDMEDLMSKAVNQNFVPVVDDKDIFIGIITRKDIIQYLDRQRRKDDRVSAQVVTGGSPEAGENWNMPEQPETKERWHVQEQPDTDESGNAQELSV